MTDIYFKLITQFWVGYFEFIEQGGELEQAQKRKDKFLNTLKGYLPVTSLKYSDNPFKLTFHETDGGLISVTQLSDTEEPLYPERIGKHTLLTVEHFNGCWSALYAIEMGES